MNTSLLQFEGVSRTFVADGVETKALVDVDLDIRAGEFVCVTGPSGSGKTTLMNLFGCLDRPTSGTYRIAGADVGALSSDDRARLRRETFGFVLQSYNLLESATARDNVELPATYTDMAARRRRQRAGGLLESFGLGDRMDHEPSQLSGGEQQRVAIARALMNDAQVILADEPTGALDTAQSDEILALLEQLAERGHAVIVVSHDRNVAARAHRQVKLAGGRVVQDESGRPAGGHVAAGATGTHFPGHRSNGNVSRCLRWRCACCRRHGCGEDHGERGRAPAYWRAGGWQVRACPESRVDGRRRRTHRSPRRQRSDDMVSIVPLP